VSPPSSEDVCSIARELVDAVRLLRDARAAGSTRVERDRPVVVREDGNLLAPRPQRLAEPFDQ